MESTVCRRLLISRFSSSIWTLTCMAEQPSRHSRRRPAGGTAPHTCWVELGLEEVSAWTLGKPLLRCYWCRYHCHGWGGGGALLAACRVPTILSPADGRPRLRGRAGGWMGARSRRGGGRAGSARAWVCVRARVCVCVCVRSMCHHATFAPCKRPGISSTYAREDVPVHLRKCICGL
jgi:hypothetical protein